MKSFMLVNTVSWIRCENWMGKILSFVCESLAIYDKYDCTFSEIFTVVIMDCLTKGWFSSFSYPGLHLCADQPSKVLLSPNDVFVKWPIRAQLKKKSLLGFLEPRINYLHGSVMYYSNTLSTKKAWKKRWGRKEIDDIKSQSMVNEEREWSGWIFFLFPHTFTLWYKLLCTPHHLRSLSAKKQEKRLLKWKIWSKTNVCARITRITLNNRNESYQNQFAVIGYLPGPWGFWTLTLLQSLFTANFAVCFPARKALRETETDKYVKADFFSLFFVLF